MKQLSIRLTILSLSGLFLFNLSAQAQTIKDILGSKAKMDSGKTTTAVLNEVSNVLVTQNSLSTNDIASGLKEALEQGVTKGTKQLSSLDGYFGNEAIKILMPPEAKKVEDNLRKLGLGKQVDEAITSMNRAAEDAAKSAAPIFVKAIKGMSFQDAMNILKGPENAATEYLKNTTTKSLTEAFRPVIDSSLIKVDATKYWNTVFSTYNRVAFKKINPDLTEYVTERALSGLFYKIAEEEVSIRKNPAARTTELLKKVFGN